MTPGNPARMARWACLGALVTVLVGCSDNVTAWRKDNSGGLYPAGEISGEPTFGVGWRRRLTDDPTASLTGVATACLC